MLTRQQLITFAEALELHVEESKGRKSIFRHEHAQYLRKAQVYRHAAGINNLAARRAYLKNNGCDPA